VIDSRDREGEEASFGGGHKYWVTFTEYGNTCSVDLGDIELVHGRILPPPLSPSSNIPEKRSDSSSPGRGRKAASASRSRSRSPAGKKGHGEVPKDLLTQVLDKERQGSVAVGKHYASRPVSYKSSLSLQLDRYTTRQKSPSRTATSDRDWDRDRNRDRDRDRDRNYRGGRSRSRDRDDRSGGRDRERDRSRGRDRGGDHDRARHSQQNSSMTSSSGNSQAALERMKKLKETYGDASANSNL
jgi:hypothetical protein